MSVDTAHSQNWRPFEGALDLFDLLIRALVRIARWLVIFISLFITVTMVAGVFARFLFNSSLGWTEEVSSLMLAVMMFLAVGVGVHTREHIGVGILIERLSPYGQRLADAVLHLISAAFFIIIGWAGIRFAEVGMGMMLATVGVPRGVFYWAVPVGSAFAGLVCLNNVSRILRGLDKPRFGGAD